MKKINSLTPEQQSRFGEWTQKWVDIGLSTEPADFDAATDAALKAYKLCNLDKPLVVLRMGSPYAATIGGGLAWMILKDMKYIGDQVRAQVSDQVYDQVYAQVGAQVGAQVRAQVRAQVYDQVGDQVRAQVYDQVRDQVRAQVGAWVKNYGITNLYWSGFSAWVSFFRDVCGWSDPILKKFEITETLVKSCGWTWWHQNVLAISDRPSIINRDNQGRLHCETGPSIAYRDGWSLYHWHGVLIPKEWVTGSKPTPAEAIIWPNIEQRWAACEIVGWVNIMAELNPKLIDEDGDPEIGALFEVELPDSGKERFLKVLCGTKREFVLPVPRKMKTAIQASAWTYGIDELHTYKPEVRT